jgi:hypothetical protein
MPFNSAGKLRLLLSASLTLMLLTGCGEKKPPIVSADTYCIRSAPITTTAKQKSIIGQYLADFRSLIDQLNVHNDTYEANCTASKG